MRRAPRTHAVLHTRPLRVTVLLHTRPLRVTALPTPALAWPLQDTHDTQSATARAILSYEDLGYTNVIRNGGAITTRCKKSMGWETPTNIDTNLVPEFAMLRLAQTPSPVPFVLLPHPLPACADGATSNRSVLHSRTPPPIRLATHARERPPRTARLLPTSVLARHSVSVTFRGAGPASGPSSDVRGRESDRTVYCQGPMGQPCGKAADNCAGIWCRAHENGSASEGLHSPDPKEMPVRLRPPFLGRGVALQELSPAQVGAGSGQELSLW